MWSSFKTDTSWNFVFTSILACMCISMVGISVGYGSPSVPDLNRNPNPLHLNIAEHSWFVSVNFFGAICGSLGAGNLIDGLGRKCSLIIGSVPYVFGYLCIAAAHRPITLYIGQFWIGVAQAIYLSTVSIYLAETALPKIRCIVVALHDICLNSGLLNVYIVGAFLHWNWLAIYCSSQAVILTLALLIIPESPRWLIMNGELEVAKCSLKWLRSTDTVIDEEMKEIKDSLIKSTKTSHKSRLFRFPQLKYFIISQLLFVFRELTSVNVMRVYAVTIFQWTDTPTDPYWQAVVVATIALVGTFLSPIIIYRFQRVTTLIISFTGIAASMATMGTFFYLQNLENPSFVNTYFYWLPLVSLFGAFFFYAFGCGPLPHIIVSEIFSTHNRGFAHSLGVCTAGLSAFMTTKYFVYVRLSLGNHGVFWLSSGCCVVGALFTFCFLPETKGKSLEQLGKQLR